MSSVTLPGPFSGPSDTTWRRQRLMRLGSSDYNERVTVSEIQSPVSSPNPPTMETGQSDESSNLLPTTERVQGGYGSILRTRAIQRKTSLPGFRTRRGLPPLMLPNLGTSRNTASAMHSPVSTLSDVVYDRGSRLSRKAQRPLSAYDAQFLQDSIAQNSTDQSANINGIRVWYSSFSSIDWLHDAIKDSLRRSRLRRRKSTRSRIHLALDRSIGWIIITIVGVLTAFTAYGVLQGEQWLFTFKEGYCTTRWWMNLVQCCPDLPMTENPFDSVAEDEYCSAWRTWGQAFGPKGVGFTNEFIEYAVYACIALTWALVSCLLTIYLTASTSFVTRKESGVLAPDFPYGQDESKAPIQPKRKLMYYAAGSGIPEIKTILSGFVIHGYLGGRVLFTKSVGLALSVASGLSLGKEGPFVHIASCVGNIVSRFVPKYENNEAKRREILSAACAAGVAVAFGAPIGGTLFSLEEVSYFFPPKVMWRSFFCAMIAAITLKFLDPFGTGKLVLFQVTYDKDWHAYELIFFLLLGLFGGVYGAYFSKLNYRWSRDVRNRTWLKSHPVIEVLLVTLLTAMLCFINPWTRMGGTELVSTLFLECPSNGGSAGVPSPLCVLDPGNTPHVWSIVRAILVALVVKAALTIITFGIKVPAGIFIPTLGVGACAGRILGIGVQWLQWRYPGARMWSVCHGDSECVIPGLYAMVGAAATLSGVTRTTVSLAVIMFELTDTLTYAVPVMLSVLVAKTVADALEPKGIYDLVIELSQLPYLDAKTSYSWGTVQVCDTINRDVAVIRLDHENTVESLRNQLQEILSRGHDDIGFPILRPDVDGSDKYRMVGYIGANELEHGLSVVADQPDHVVSFHSMYWPHMMASSFSSASLADDNIRERGADLFDFSVYMDKAPLTIQNNSPMELVHQLFVKLGARYVVVTDADGLYEGVIDKKTLLAFLNEMESKA